MIIASQPPRSPARARRAQPTRQPAAPRTASAAWRLLAPGDAVSLADGRAYEIVHLSHGRAWLSGADGSQILADAAALTLRQGEGPGQRMGAPARH